MNPRRHHYCPAGYLANFANPSERIGFLIATDVKTGKERRSTPNNEAHQRDFYRIDADENGDPFQLETEFLYLEAAALAALREIIQSNKLPDHELMQTVIAFIGLLAVRVPAQRSYWENAEKTIYSNFLRMVVSSRDRYDAVLSNMRKSGEKIDHPYEDMKQFIENERFEISVSKNSLLRTMLNNASIVTELLSKRNWCLVTTNSEVEFIASDNPVGIRWIKPVKGYFKPGYGISNTEVSLAISPKHTLIGVFEEIKGTFEIAAIGVAAANEQKHIRATRFLYSHSRDTQTIDKDQNILSYIDRIKS